MKDAAAQRLHSPGRIELNGPSQQIIKTVEALGSVDERHNVTALLFINTRGHVHQNGLADQFGGMVSQRQQGHPPKRHSDHRARFGPKGLHGCGDVSGVADYIGAPCPRRPLARVSVAGQIKTHQRAAQSQRNCVPGVGVLGATMQEDKLGWTIAPYQRADVSPVCEIYLLSTHNGRTVIGQPELRSVLVKHRKLVVGHHFNTHRQVQSFLAIYFVSRLSSEITKPAMASASPSLGTRRSSGFNGGS